MPDSEVFASSHVLPRTFTGNSRDRRVLIECPIAGTWISTGARARSLGEIADVRHFTTEGCEACGQLHAWWRRDAVLAQ